jgi:uncharacterized protein involved in exopolysaccharide biosynthesis
VVEHLSQRTLESSEDQDLLRASAIEEAPELEQKGQITPILALTQLLWQRRVLLGKITLAGLVIAVVITLMIPNAYEATVQLMPPDSSSTSGGMATLGLMMATEGGGSSSSGGGLAGSLGGLLTGQDTGQLFVGVLSSRTIADRLINRFDLRKEYWRKTYAATRKKLGSRTSISADRKTGLVKIMVSDSDRNRAAAMAQAYVEELDHLMAQVNTSAASREREFLEQRLAVVHQELDASAKELSEFSSKNTTLDPEKQGEAMVQAAAVLQGELIASQSELRGLEQIYTSENVRVRSLQAHVNELQQQLNKLGGKNYDGSTTLDADALYPSLRQLPVLGLKYAEFYRRVKVDETVFEMLTKAYELAKVEEAKETPSVKVLDAAQPPEQKSWPPRTLLTLLGGFVGFVVGCCWIAGTEMWAEMDPDNPHKKFIRQTWSETKPFLQEKRSQLLRGMPFLLSHNGNSSQGNDDPSH